MCFPSGDQAGSKSPAGSSVRRVALPVARSISQISLALRHRPRRQLGNRQLLAVRAQIEIAQTIPGRQRFPQVVRCGPATSAAVPFSSAAGTRVGRSQETENTWNGADVGPDLHSKGHGVAFQLESLLVEGLRHQVPATHEEQMSCGVSALAIRTFQSQPCLRVVSDPTRSSFVVSATERYRKC